MAFRAFAMCLLATCAFAALQEYPLQGVLAKYPRQGGLVRTVLITRATVTVRWVESFAKLPKACGENSLACAQTDLHPDTDTSECTIWAVKPKDFNDEVMLAILGHELLHCLGADHEVLP